MSPNFPSFSDELLKIAARKALKLMREAMGGKERMKALRTASRRTRRQTRRESKLPEGVPIETARSRPIEATRPAISPEQLAEAQRIGALPGALKRTTPGSQIFDLGRGGEGVATAVARPGIEGQPAVQVRKLYDPAGLTSAETIRRKDIVGRAIGKHPDIAEYYGQSATAGGGTMQFSEMIPSSKELTAKNLRGRALDEARKADQAKFLQARRGTMRASAAAGFSDPQDVRRANMVLDPRTNTYKMVDFIPAKPGEFHKLPVGYPSNLMSPTERGMRLLTPMEGRVSTPTGKLKAQQFGLRRAALPRGGAATSPIKPQATRAIVTKKPAPRVFA